MSTKSLIHKLDQLAEATNQFEPAGARKVSQLLDQLARHKFTDADLLIRCHELLLFLRAYPHNAQIAKQTDTLLRTFPTQVARLLESDSDLSSLEHPEFSGVAGMSVTDTFSYPIVAWLAKRNPADLDLYWRWFEDDARIGQTWPRFMPLLEEDSFVEANVPYRNWLKNARGRRAPLAWLMERFSQLELSDTERSELYDGQKLYVCWQYRYRDSRTGMRLRGQKLFFHKGPLIARRDVRFDEEFKKPAPKLTRLAVSEGRAAIEMARVASTVRYRELYGFTHGDARSVYRTSLGRGVELFIITLPPGKRLPLRAYHSAMIYKNGVPIGYFEGLSLFERMESGFNLYYTFRDGETAWLYAKTLHVMKHLTGVSSFWLDPYQIGFENDEGIKSGAYWFYRKLGFRSVRPSIRQLTEKEEKKIATRKNYRTSPAMLRRLAQAPMILELDESRRSDWDRFQMRHIGFAVQRVMAARFGGDANKMRRNAVSRIGRLLDVDLKPLSTVQTRILSDFGLVLEVAGVTQMSEADRQLLKAVIGSKARGSESRYLRLAQKHELIRKLILKLGSG